MTALDNMNEQQFHSIVPGETRVSLTTGGAGYSPRLLGHSLEVDEVLPDGLSVRRGTSRAPLKLYFVRHGDYKVRPQS